MKKYVIGKEPVDSVELKCLLISKGVIVDNAIYKKFGHDYRLNPSPLTCNSLMLSDGTNVQLTDVGFHLKHLFKALSWNNLKLLKYESELGTPFHLQILDDKPALFYEKDWVDFVTFHTKTDFYRQKTASGLPYIGNAVLQGCDFVSFQCLWPCEYAAHGKPCEYCFSGAEFESLAQKGKPQPLAVEASDVAEIVQYAVRNGDANSVQITGGSTFSGKTEYNYISAYLKKIAETETKLAGEILLYITPPEDLSHIDDYFSLGADRIACSVEVWDEVRARIITPGKMHFTTRQRHLEALDYIAEKHGKNKAFSNFIIGLESLETLQEGATYLAERGIIPSASVWIPLGRPVMGSMKAPSLDYFRRVKEMFAELYSKYELSPAGGCGLNVCVEKDIYNYSKF
ncbi:radical SAM protein [Viscerimonas tarda]